MTDLTHMKIGDVNFFISCNNAVKIQEPEPIYRSFFNTTNPSSDFRPSLIKVHLQIGGMPDTNNFKTLFNSHQSWSMFQNNEGYCLSFHPPGFELPFWLAKISRDFSRATVYCSEKAANRENGCKIISNPVCYPLDQILLMYILAPRQGMLLHAAGIDIHGNGYIFPGKSGAGKTTLTRQFADKKNMALLSDDRIVVRKIDGVFKAYGTPWPGEAGIANNASIPLSGIFFINHGSANRIRELIPGQALKRLLPVTSIPWYDRDIMSMILDFCEDLISNVPIYELDFKPSIDVVEVFEKFVSSI